MKSALNAIIQHCGYSPGKSPYEPYLKLLKVVSGGNGDGVNLVAFDRYLDSQITSLFKAYVAAKGLGMKQPIEKPLLSLIGSFEIYKKSSDKFLEKFMSTAFSSGYDGQAYYTSIQGKAKILLKAIEDAQNPGKENEFKK
ncbi:MAG: hypothetical protein WC861_07305 [Candidatus Micrarchaeia archaeon]|jgi:hypothetical protein